MLSADADSGSAQVNTVDSNFDQTDIETAQNWAQDFIYTFLASDLSKYRTELKLTNQINCEFNSNYDYKTEDKLIHISSKYVDTVY